MRITLLVTVDVEDAASFGDDIGVDFTDFKDASIDWEAVKAEVANEVGSTFDYHGLTTRVDNLHVEALRAAVDTAGAPVVRFPHIIATANQLVAWTEQDA